MALNNTKILTLFVAGILALSGCGGGGGGDSSSPVSTANSAPVANAQNITIDKDTIDNTITLTASDEEGDLLTYTITVQPNNGILSGTAPNLTYTPTVNYAGSDSLTFRVNDGTVNSAEVTVNITVRDAAAPVAYKLKKTGQINSYAAYDDGDYQTGVEHSYTRDDVKQIVTDHVTGLGWQDDVEAASVTKPWVTQANYDEGRYDDTSGETATTYCTNLSLDGGGWRLPTRAELVGIVDYANIAPAISPVFKNVASNNYWSSTTTTTSDGYAGYVWVVHFNFGVQYSEYKHDNFYVRCVRAGQ